MRILCASVLVAFLLSGCATQPAPGSPEERMQEVAQERAAQVEIISRSVSEAPEWFTNPPESGAAIYAVGAGTQRNLALAKGEAMNMAKVELASRFGTYIEGFNGQYMDGEGGSFVTGSRSAFRQKLVGWNETKSAMVETNGMVQWYVLLEYPTGDANRLIFGEIKKNQNDLLQARKNEGFRMMEEMLESRGVN